MLYQYLLDDVARKQPKPKPVAQRQQTEEYVESPSGELIASKEAAANESKFRLLRTRSAPKRKKAFHYPLNALRQNDWEHVEDDSQPNSPQLPAFAATRTAKDELQRGTNRLTM